jgi:hypothetical protein
MKTKYSITLPQPIDADAHVAIKGLKGFPNKKEVRHKLIAIRISENEVQKIDAILPEGMGRSTWIRLFILQLAEKIPQSAVKSAHPYMVKAVARGLKGFPNKKEVRHKLIAIRISENEGQKIDAILPEGMGRSVFIREVILQLTEKVAQSL